MFERQRGKKMRRNERGRAALQPCMSNPLFSMAGEKKTEKKGEKKREWKKQTDRQSEQAAVMYSSVS